MEKNIGDDVLGAIYFPNDGSVNPRKLTREMFTMAQKEDVQFSLSQNISDLKFLDGKYSFKTTHIFNEDIIGNVETENLIVAAGAFTTKILAQLDINGTLIRNLYKLVMLYFRYLNI